MNDTNGTLPQLSAAGQYLVGPDGNPVILRGFNLCSKSAASPGQLGFGSDAAKYLASQGVSVVRLGLPWTNVQPELAYGPDNSLQYNMTFLASIKETIEILAAAGIYTLVDFHQDGYAYPWGFGAPAWAVLPGAADTTNTYGWIVNTFGGTTYELGTTATTIETDLNIAFDAFWGNSPVPNGPINLQTGKVFTLWEAYGAMLQFVATYLSDQKGNILGYDPLNEPEPGSLWTEGYIPPSVGDPKNYLNFANGFPKADELLGGFYRECAIPSLRAGHPDAMIWFEPNIYFDYNGPTSLPDLAGEFGNVGFNFHNYDNTSSGDTLFYAPIGNALNYQQFCNGSLPLLCSEFGGTTLYGNIRTVADYNDCHMLSSIYWAWFNNAAYPFYGNVDAAAMGVVQSLSEAIEPPNLNLEMLAAVSRVYPRVTAGTPISFSSASPDIAQQFSFTYTNQLPNGQPASGKTVIAVPAILFPQGFNVSAPGAEVHQLDGIVELTVNSSTPTTITVQITSK